MSTAIARFAPIGAVAGVLGYLCWPYLDDPAKPPPSKANKAAALTADLLSPPAAADLTRNIFESAAAPSAPPPTVDTSSPQVTEPVAEKPSDSVTTAPDSLVLSGTFVRGKNRVALINDALYAAGDQIPAAIVNSQGCRVKSVEVDRVLLDIDGRQAELVYRDLLASTAETLTSAGGATDEPERSATSSPSAAQPAKSPAK